MQIIGPRESKMETVMAWGTEISLKKKMKNTQTFFLLPTILSHCFMTKRSLSEFDFLHKRRRRLEYLLCSSDRRQLNAQCQFLVEFCLEKWVCFTENILLADS